MIIIRRTTHLFILFAISIGLSSCGFWKRPQSTTTTQPSPVTTHGVAPKPVDQGTPQTIETTWVFTVDPNHSRGKIDLSLDPKGSLLGAKPAQDTAPLKGQIHVTVSTSPSGKQRIQLKEVHLTNTVALAMPFHWSRIVGSIAVDIPVHVLKITKNKFPRPCELSRNGSFVLPENYFTVMGNAKVSGSGLVLGKAVGKRDVDLTIKKTENVEVKGSMHIKNRIATLHIPNAVMRDQFDMEGSMLGLVFTGDITATAPVPR